MPVDQLRRRSFTTPISVMVRALALALALALVVTGCGGEDKEKPKPAADKATASETPGTEPAKAEPAPDPGYQAPKVGQCYRLTSAQSRASVVDKARVKCGGKHTTVVAYVGFVPKPVTPKTRLAKKRALGTRVCAPAYRRYVGGTLADRATSILTWTLFTPSQAQLERGARWVRCDVLARSGEHLIALPEGDSLLDEGVPEQLRICQTDAGADISCSRAHAFRVEAVFRSVGRPYPDPARYTAVARDRCKELMGEYGGYWQPPSKSGWNAGDRFVRCLAPQQ